MCIYINIQKNQQTIRTNRECYGIEERINNIQKPRHQRVLKDYNFKNPIQKVINPNRDLEINKKRLARPFV